ncbi:hypothetical protein TrVFT333_002273 [Trichoderma virens FT-333]|nr:hypothetical protein TrVFT333_002273 [Trichoderma virens FT-333]
MASSGVCLDVAIDHRIRQLLQPAINIEANPSDGSHLKKLEQLHQSVHDKEVDALDELLVTKELAKPLSKGGLVVALIRPASNHPFADGVEVVVEESPTLRALRDVLHSEYASAVTKIQDLIPVLASDKYDCSRYLLKKEALYHTLIDAKWTEHMNDASLCLKAAARELKRDIVDFHDTIGPQGDMARQTMRLLMRLGMKFRGSEKMEVRNAPGRGFFSETFTNSVRNEKPFSTSSSWFLNRALKRRMVNFLLDLNNAFLDAKEADDIQGPIRFQLSLDGASKAFLTMACGMEDLLGTLAAYLGELKVAKSNTEQHAEPDDGKSQIKAAGDVSEESTTLVGDFEGLAL